MTEEKYETPRPSLNQIEAMDGVIQEEAIRGIGVRAVVAHMDPDRETFVVVIHGFTPGNKVEYKLDSGGDRVSAR